MIPVISPFAQSRSRIFAAPKSKTWRLVTVILLSALLTSCLAWMRAYQTYLQLDEFDKHFSVEAKDDFTLHFKHPILLSEDFVTLSKLRASESVKLDNGRRWRYLFKKVDEQGTILKPETSFFFDLKFNRLQQLTSWTFSPLFLQIAPANFLETSLRSMAGANINEGEQHLRTNPELIKKISAQLPLKDHVVAQLGEPLAITSEKDTEIYRYHFMLQTAVIEKGYEDRALNAVHLTFDLKTHELVKMSGRFAGLKVSINYRNYQDGS